VQALGLPSLIPLEPSDQLACDSSEEESEEGGEEGSERSDVPLSESYQGLMSSTGQQQHRLGPSDLQPMMDLLDEVERSCLIKSEASVRSSVRASVDRSERRGGTLFPP